MAKNTKTGKVQKETAAPNLPTFGDDEEFEEVRLGLDIRTMDEENHTIRGIFVGTDTLKDEEGKPKINEQYGNEREYAQFRDLKGEQEFGVWLDGGLRGALNFNQVKPGMAVRVTYTGRKDVDTDYGIKSIRQFQIVGLQPKGTRQSA